MTTRSVIPFEPSVPAAESARSVTTSRPRVLVVDDEPSMRELLGIVLEREGYDVTALDCGTAAIAWLQEKGADLVVSDIRMPDVSGVDVLRAARRGDPELPVVMMTAFASTESAVEALRLGASDYVTKPFDLDELKIVIRHALERRQLKQENFDLKRALKQTHRFVDIIGRSDAMLAVFRLIETIGPTNSTVLITGESGTGKELAARAIHYHSLRRDRPFVALNCGALPETLLESELFGHMRGAFTGADSNRKGLIELAATGTIFLDEIGEMSASMQVKLLRVLQERKFRRVGGPAEIDADIRIIAATNRDLSKAVAEGQFREDLFYRVNVIPLVLPPLRERREDISLLAAHFAEKFAKQMGKAIVGLSGEALICLEQYAWPGNIRELENAIERAVALEHTPTVLAESLPEAVTRLVASVGPQPLAAPDGDDTIPPARGAAAPAELSPLSGAGFDLEQHVQNIERQYIAEALRQANGVKVRAAEMLGMSFRSFRYYLKKYDLR